MEQPKPETKDDSLLPFETSTLIQIAKVLLVLSLVSPWAVFIYKSVSFSSLLAMFDPSCPQQLPCIKTVSLASNYDAGNCFPNIVPANLYCDEKCILRASPANNFDSRRGLCPPKKYDCENKDGECRPVAVGDVEICPFPKNK